MKLNTLKPADGARKSAPRRPRHRFRPRQDRRPRPQRFVRAFGQGKIKAGFEGGQMPMQRRLPKIGFRSKKLQDTAEVLLYQLDKLDAGTVDFAALRAAKLVPSTAKQAKVVKKGEISKKFVLKGVLARATSGRRARLRDRGRRRQVGSKRRMARSAQAMGSLGGVGKFTELRQRLLFLGRHDRLPHRLLHPGAGRQSGGDAAPDGFAEGHHRGHVQHVLRRRAAALQPVRAERRSPTSPPRSSSSCWCRSCPA